MLPGVHFSRDRKRLLFLFLLGGGLSIYLMLASTWPRPQTVHFVLGAAAAQITGLGVSYRSAREGSEGSEGEASRTATFSYERGTAPRVVTHDVPLANGDYRIEIEVISGNSSPATVARRVLLNGGAVSIDLSEAIASAHERGGRQAD